jgi:hexosaminidase
MPKMMGVQGNLWTEYITDESHFEYMLYPRAFDIAEIGWSASDSQSENVRERAKKLSTIFRNNGYTVFDLETEVGIDDILIGSTLEHKGYKATFTLEGVHPQQKFEFMDTRLTDGRQRTFMRFEDKATVVMKLNKIQNIN